MEKKTANCTERLNGEVFIMQSEAALLARIVKKELHILHSLFAVNVMLVKNLWAAKSE